MATSNLATTYRTKTGVKTAEEFRRETQRGQAPSNLVQLTPENIQAIEKSGGVQAGTPLATALAGKSVQVVQMKGGLTPQQVGFQPNVYYTITPSPRTQLTNIPPTTTSAMSQAQVSDYNKQVSEAYQSQLSKLNIQYDYSLGKAGYYKQGQLYISKIFPFKDTTKAHEFGHKIDLESKEVRDYSKFKSASKNWIPDFLENIGYSKKTSPVEYEYYARAFANYIKNPEKFRKSNPEVAREFESKLGITSTQATPIEQVKVTSEPSKALVNMGEADVSGEKVIYQKPTGTYKGVPTFEYRVKEGEADRLATKEEADYLISQTGEVQAKTGKIYSTPLYAAYEKAGEIYRKANVILKEGITYPVKETVKTITGIDITEAKQISRFTPSIIGVGGYGLKPTLERDIIAGISAGVTKDVIEEPLKQVVIYGAGAGLGAGLRFAKYGGEAIAGIRGGKTIGKVVGVSGKLAGGTLAGVYAYDVGKEVYQSKDLSEAGEKIGVAAKDLAIFGFGAKMGADFGTKVITRPAKVKIYEKPETKVRYKSLSEIYAKEKGAVVFKEGEVLGKDLILVEQARGNLPRSPLEFEIKPTFEQQRQIVRFKKGLDVLEYEPIKSKFLIKEAPKEIIKPKLIEFEVKPTFEQKQQLLRLERGLDILEAVKTREGITFKARELPKPEVLKSLFNEPKPFEFGIKPTIEQRNQLRRFERGLDIAEYEPVKGKFNIRTQESPEVLKHLEPIEIKIFQVPKELRELTLKSYKEPIGIKPSELAKSRKGTLYLEKTPSEWKESGIKTDILGSYTKAEFSNVPEIKDIIAVQKGKGISIQKTEAKVLHELTHAETKNLFTEKLERGLPYKQRPSELVAKEFEKLINERGEINIKKFITEKPKFEKKVITMKDIYKEPTQKPVSYGRQQLVQVMKEPETKIVSRVKTRTLGESRFADMIPEGKIKPFEDLGKIKDIGIAEGRIPTGYLDQLEKEATRKVGRIKTDLIQEKRIRGFKVFGRVKQSENLLDKEISVSLNRELTKDISAQIIKQPSVLVQPQPSLSMLKEPQVFKQPQIFRQPQIEKQVQRYRYKEPELFKELLITKKKKRLLPPLFKRKKGMGDLGLGKGFDVFRIRKGKKTILAKGLYKESALDVGARETLRDLSASFGISKSDISPRDVSTMREFEIYGEKFRRPTKKSRLRKFGEDIFVQKQTGRGGRLFSKGELKEIKLSKERKMEKYLR